MGLLFLIAIVVFVIWLAARSSKGSSNNGDTTNDPLLDAQLDKRNQEWATFIAGYSVVAKSKQEKKLLVRMLTDVKQQGLTNSIYADQLIAAVSNEKSKHSVSMEPEPVQAITESAISTATVSLTEASENDNHQALTAKLDNISLLLYFGAFLFVASAGLFVSFADVSGSLRTVVVLAVCLVMYATGIWIYKNKSKLQPAGLAFAGIGMSIAPLTGVAAYNLVFQGNSATVWFATSLFCLVLYLHSMFVLRKPLVNYIFIFTLLSLFESSVAIINAPIYYFGWAMALLAIVVQLVSLKSDLWPEFREASRTSGQLFLPFAILISLVVVGTEGIGQFGVSLLLAACYYGLQAYVSEGGTQESNASIAHVSLLASIAALTYAVGDDFVLTGIVLLSFAVAQVLYVWMTHATSGLMLNFGSVTMASILAALLFTTQNKQVLLIEWIIATALFAVIWAKQKRPDAYVLAGLGWLSLPLLYGQIVSDPRLTINSQVTLVLISLAIHVLAFLGIARKTKQDYSLIDSARAVLLFHVIIAIIVSFFAGPLAALLAISITALILLPLSFFEDANYWSILSGIVVSLSVVRCWSDDVMLPFALCIALGYNILLALRFRAETSRWLSTILWLLLPLGLGGFTSTERWTSEQYTWAYMIVLIGLLISRSIARGAIFASSKIPLSSYAKTASQSYVVGYTAAGLIALLFSLGTENSQLHTSLILASLSIVTLIIAWKIEKRADIVALQPIIWQLLLLSILRPGIDQENMAAFLLVSSIISAAFYWLSTTLLSEDEPNAYISVETQKTALLTIFITPLSFFIVGETLWPMPAGLLLSAGLLFNYWQLRPQKYKETACALAVVSCMWFLHYFGVTEIQVYTHLLAAMFAGFAFWRSSNDDQKQSDNYLYWMLATATVPLALQAIASESGGLFGWWLLLEQVMFMLLGIAIKRRFVVMWGLYVAIGAVLYQLRNLGWAALTVLAMFIIGVAVYQLQKYNKPEDK